MKDLLKTLWPTLAPIAGLAVTAVAPSVQHLLSSFIGSHPVWASTVGAVSLIVNHWLPSPAQPAAK